MTRSVAMLGAALFGAVLAPDGASAQDGSWGITAVQGITVGHLTMSARPTGCTVILTGEGAVGGVDVRGGAPGTAETDLLDPVNTVQEVHGITLSAAARSDCR